MFRIVPFVLAAAAGSLAYSPPAKAPNHTSQMHGVVVGRRIAPARGLTVATGSGRYLIEVATGNDVRTAVWVGVSRSQWANAYLGKRY